MNTDVWNTTIKDYLKSYESIHHLMDRGILDEDDTPMLFMKLLEDIITTFESEVKE